MIKQVLFPSLAKLPILRGAAEPVWRSSRSHNWEHFFYIYPRESLLPKEPQQSRRRKLYEDHSACCRQGRTHAPLTPAICPSACSPSAERPSSTESWTTPAPRPHRDHLHHRLQGRSHGPLPGGQARMGQDPHRTPERPAGSGAGNKPRAPLRKRRRAPAHHTRRHPVRCGSRATRGRKRECAVHLRGAGSPTLRRCRHRRKRAFPATQGRALAA